MTNEIQPGDVVTLKSGSPSMTVDEVGDNYGTLTAWCSWFDGKKVVRDSFPASSLKKSPTS
jgi:uncharacterized protein YodC (DUF2158 family)